MHPCTRGRIESNLHGRRRNGHASFLPSFHNSPKPTRRVGRWQVRQAEEGRAAGQEGRQEGCQGLSPIQPICIEILNIIFFSRLCIVLADQDCNAENHDAAGKPQLHAFDPCPVHAKTAGSYFCGSDLNRGLSLIFSFHELLPTNNPTHERLGET